jgi:plasmid stabilization system protein ParE
VLRTQPKIGKVWENEHMVEYRELIEGKYRIFYHYNPKTNEVKILSVFHSSRNIKSLIL